MIKNLALVLMTVFAVSIAAFGQEPVPSTTPAPSPAPQAAPSKPDTSHAAPILLPSGTNKVIDRIAAVVDNEIILESELFQYVQYSAGSAQALEAMTQSQVDTMKKVILDQLIDQKLLLVAARGDTNVTVDDRQVDSELDTRVKTLIQQAGGQDRLEEYYGMPLAKIKRQFRPLVEEGILIEKVKQSKVAKVQVGPSEVERFWQAYKDSIPPLKDAVRISHILLVDSVSESSKQAAIALADSARNMILAGKVTFEEFASKNSDDVASASKGGKLGLTNRGELVPEYETVAYNLKPGEISQPVISPFGVHIIRLDERLGEKINSSHILFKIVPSAEDRARTEARADSIMKAIKAGADFTEMAAKFSTDTKTAGKGGDLGWLAPAELPEEFKAPLTDAKKGDVVGPVRTKFGVHILMVTDRINARPITLADDYDRIQRMALAKKQDEVITKWLHELAAKTYIDKKD